MEQLTALWLDSTWRHLTIVLGALLVTYRVLKQCVTSEGLLRVVGSISILALCICYLASYLLFGLMGIASHVAATVIIIVLVSTVHIEYRPSPPARADVGRTDECYYCAQHLDESSEFSGKCQACYAAEFKYGMDKYLRRGEARPRTRAAKEQEQRDIKAFVLSNRDKH